MRPDPSAQVRLDSIANYITRLGVYGEDPATAGRPNLDGRLTAYELDVLYLRNDLARRIIDELVEDALRGGFEVRDLESNEVVFEASARAEVPSDSLEEKKAKEAAPTGATGPEDTDDTATDADPMNEEPDDGDLDPSDDPTDDDLDVVHIFDEACKTARLYGGAHVLIINDDGDLSQPLDFNDPGEIHNLIVLDRWEATPVTYTQDPRDKNFARPEIYQVTPATNGGGLGMVPVPVHFSRLLRFDGNKLPRRLRIWNEDYNDSILQVVWDALRNFTQTESAIATIVQRFETVSIEIAGLSEALASADDGMDLITKRMDLIHKSLSLLNAALLDADGGEKYNRQYATVTGLDTIWDRLAHSVSKAARMPMTQLFGMSPSGLSSDDESGRANWRKQVASYQKDQLRPRLETYFRLKNKGKRVYIVFPPLDESTAMESATIEKLTAETDSIRIKDGVIDRLEARQNLLDAGKLVDRGIEPEKPAPPPLPGQLPGENGEEMPKNGEKPSQNGKKPPKSSPAVKNDPKDG